MLNKEEVFIERPPIRVVYNIVVHGVIVTEKYFVFMTLSFPFSKERGGEGHSG